MDPNGTDEGTTRTATLDPEHALTLVLAGDGFDSCLSGLCDPDTEFLLRVSYGGSPRHVADDWEAAFDRSPTRSLEVVASGGGTAIREDDTRRVAHVPPGDLTGLGVTLSGALERCSAGGVESALCFDSLTVVLQFVEPRIVFQFLHTLAGLIRTAGTRTHFHLDPTAVDERTVATLKSLFDALVTVDTDGRVSVQSK